MRIEICGGIAAGKTTLAEHLSRAVGCQLVKEHYRSVPYWRRFYEAPARYALEKNFSFLLAHADAIPERSESRNQIVICDFAMFQDLAYANLGPEADFPAISCLYERLVARMEPPRFIVHVTCSTAMQLARIEARARSAERTIDERYLVNLDAEIESWLGSLKQHAETEILKVDNDIDNVATLISSGTYENLCGALKSFRPDSGIPT